MKSAQIYKKTKESLGKRKRTYFKYAKEPENKLLTNSNMGSFLSISHYFPNLNTYESKIKSKHEIFTISQPEGSTSPCPSLIPPASSGEDSLYLSEDQEKIGKRVLSLKEICSILIDSNLIKTDKPTPRYININQLIESIETHYYSRKTSAIPNDKPRELLFFDIKDSIEDDKIIYEHLKEVFSHATKSMNETVKLHVSRIKLCYYKGKYSALVRFGDPETAAYLYFNFSNFIKQKTRDILGSQFSVYHVLENNVKAKNDDWVAVVMRGLNQQIEKEHIVLRLKEKLNLTPKWIEELVMIKHHKYALVGVASIEEAEMICKHFKQSLDIKHKIKANIHPRSSKYRKLDENKFKSFLTFNKPAESTIMFESEDEQQIIERNEAESIKEQIKQKMYDFKNSRKFLNLSGIQTHTTSLPELINFFKQNDQKEQDIISSGLKNLELNEKNSKTNAEKSEKKEEDYLSNRNSSKNHKKYSDVYGSKSYYSNLKYQSFEENEKNAKNKKRDRTRSRSRSRTRNKSISKSKNFSNSRSKEEKKPAKYYEKKRSEKNFKRSKSRKNDRSKSKNSPGKYKPHNKYATKNEKYQKKYSSRSKSRSSSFGKSNKITYYKKRSGSNEKKSNNNSRKVDSKEKYRKKYLNDLRENEDFYSHNTYAKNCRPSYYETHPLEKNPIVNSNATSILSSFKQNNDYDNNFTEESNKKTIKKENILKRINQRRDNYEKAENVNTHLSIYEAYHVEYMVNETKNNNNNNIENNAQTKEKPEEDNNQNQVKNENSRSKSK